MAIRSAPKGDYILAVEDDADERYFLEHGLRSAGIGLPVLWANNGKEAVRILEANESPRLILSDVNMPLMDGFGLLEWVRKHRKGTSLILLSSSSHPADIARAADLHASAYLVKPDSIKELERMFAALKSFWLDWNRLQGPA